MDHKFQINLGGIIDLLSNHLYSSPAVYVRELLQNGVDAISARRHLQPEHTGHIRIHVATSDSGQPRLVFQDDGIGLTEAQTHRFLSIIGESSKRGEVAAHRGDFIGQFGIGLLSCFVVSDEIFMVTRSALPDSPVVQWRGRADGTYTTTTRHDPDVEPGTTVYLSCKPGAEEWFEPERVRRLAADYGGLLPFPVEVMAGADVAQINAEPAPWRRDFTSGAERRQAYLDFGKELFGGEFFDVIPLRSEAGDVDGAAYVLPYSPSPTARRAHRVYLKNMLLTEASDNLLPSWAFFVTCVVNTNALRPTASRESFYEDETLQRTREAMGEALRQYLIDLKRREPGRLQQLIALHYRAIKALAIHDDEFFELFVDWLPFETSMGQMSLGEYRQANEVVRYVPNLDAFRQLAPIAASQGMGVINAGYSYDADLLRKLPQVFPEARVERVDSDGLADSFTALTSEERDEAFGLSAMADHVLQTYHCRAELKRFEPADLPALYLGGDDAHFARSVENSKESSDPHWSAILNQLAGSGPDQIRARLCFNFNNPLVRKLTRIEDRDVLELAIQMLYVQALLLGHHTLSSKEMALLNTGLLDLIDRAVDPATEGGSGWMQ